MRNSKVVISLEEPAEAEGDLVVGGGASDVQGSFVERKGYISWLMDGFEGCMDRS